MRGHSRQDHDLPAGVLSGKPFRAEKALVQRVRGTPRTLSAGTATPLHRRRCQFPRSASAARAPTRPAARRAAWRPRARSAEPPSTCAPSVAGSAAVPAAGPWPGPGPATAADAGARWPGTTRPATRCAGRAGSPIRSSTGLAATAGNCAFAPSTISPPTGSRLAEAAESRFGGFRGRCPYGGLGVTVSASGQPPTGRRRVHHARSRTPTRTPTRTQTPAPTRTSLTPRPPPRRRTRRRRALFRPARPAHPSPRCRADADADADSLCGRAPPGLAPVYAR